MVVDRDFEVEAGDSLPMSWESIAWGPLPRYRACLGVSSSGRLTSEGGCAERTRLGVRHRLTPVIAGLFAMLSFPWPGWSLAEDLPVAIVQDRLYRLGVYLVVDAVIENRSATTIESVEVLVEFYDFFNELLRVEHTLVTPVTLGPGSRAAFRAVTPYTDAARKVVYRFTWRRDSDQLQAVVRRDIWTIDSATRDPGR